MDLYRWLNYFSLAMGNGNYDIGTYLPLFWPELTLSIIGKRNSIAYTQRDINAK